MNVLELNLRTQSAQERAVVKLRLIGPTDKDGCVEVTCVETVSEGSHQTIILSDEKGE